MAFGNVPLVKEKGHVTDLKRLSRIRKCNATSRRMFTNLNKIVNMSFKNVLRVQEKCPNYPSSITEISKKNVITIEDTSKSILKNIGNVRLDFFQWGSMEQKQIENQLYKFQEKSENKHTSSCRCIHDTCEILS